MNRNEIRDEVCNIINFRGFIPKELLSEDNFDLSLTGFKMRMSAISITYLFCEIQSRFDIHISDKEIKDYQFNSINGIIDLLSEKLS